MAVSVQKWWHEGVHHCAERAALCCRCGCCVPTLCHAIRHGKPQV